MYIIKNMQEKQVKTSPQPNVIPLIFLLFIFIFILFIQGYAPLFVESDHFYIRWLYKRISDAWDRPITNIPGTYIDVLEREGQGMNDSYTYFFPSHLLPFII